MSSRVKILLVENEFLVAADITRRLKKFGYDPIGTAATATEAMQLLGEKNPDLVIMDIQIEGEKNGIEVAKMVHEKANLPIVFLTQLNNQKTFEQAQEAKPYSYLTKPVTDLDLKQALDLAVLHYYETPQTPSKSLLKSNEFFLKIGESHKKLNLNDIEWIEADGAYCKLHTIGGEHVFSKSMAALVREIDSKVEDASCLLKIHKSTTVNVGHISSVKGNQLVIGETTLTIGKNHVDEVKDLLNIG